MFLDKNRDNMRLEMLELLSASKSPVSILLKFFPK